MKAARHAMILELIDKYEIETQDELAAYLRENNFSVTQATVSRDIKELRLIKSLSADGVYKYATVDKTEAGLQDRFIRIFSHSVINITSAGHLVIIKAIDSMKWSEIAGSIAGDNTIFVAIKDAKMVPEMIKRFQSMMK